MMLPSDLALKDDCEFREYSIAYRNDNELFLKDFCKAYKKLTELGF